MTAIISPDKTSPSAARDLLDKVITTISTVKLLFAAGDSTAFRAREVTGLSNILIGCLADLETVQTTVIEHISKPHAALHREAMQTAGKLFAEGLREGKLEAREQLLRRIDAADPAICDKVREILFDFAEAAS